jgi:hypothetical protein
MNTKSILRIIAFAGVLLPMASHAALGDRAESLPSDQKKMRAASRKVADRAQYKVHEMEGEAGTVVREYESSDGVIFAVTWEGPVKPDLRQLFGKYFDQYQSAERAAHTGHRRAIVRQPDLVVRSSGHMRAFSGLAYLPQQLPAGVNVDELQ